MIQSKTTRERFKAIYYLTAGDEAENVNTIASVGPAQVRSLTSTDFTASSPELGIPQPGAPPPPPPVQTHLFRGGGRPGLEGARPGVLAGGPASYSASFVPVRS